MRRRNHLRSPCAPQVATLALERLTRSPPLVFQLLELLAFLDEDVFLLRLRALISDIALPNKFCVRTGIVPRVPT